MKRIITILLALLTGGGLAAALTLLFMQRPGNAMTVALATYIPGYMLAHISEE